MYNNLNYLSLPWIRWLVLVLVLVVVKVVVIVIVIVLLSAVGMIVVSR